MSETSKTRERVLEYVKMHDNVLDIGCADDKLTPRAVGLDCRVVKGVNIRWDLRDGLPFSSEVFDVVYSSHTLEDLQRTRIHLLEWLRVLKRGGALILYLPHRDYYPNIGHEHANKGHQHDFTPEDISAYLNGMGVDIERCETFAPPDGKYDYERRGEIEYSFLIVARRL